MHQVRVTLGDEIVSRVFRCPKAGFTGHPMGPQVQAQMATYANAREPNG